MKKFFKLSLYYQYLLLYFIAVFIPALITCIALFLSYNSLKNEVVQANLSSLQLIQHSIDNKINEQNSIIQYLEQDPSLTKTALDSNPLNAINSLKRATSSQEFTNNIILHVRGSEYFYTPSGRFKQSDLENQAFCKDLIQHGYSSGEWLNMINFISKPTYWPTDNLDASSSYLYVFSPVTSSFRIGVLLINREYIHHLFLASQSDMNENILLLNSDLKVLHYLAPETSEESLLQICEYLKKSPVQGDVHHITLGNEKNLLFISRSPDTGLYYVRFLQEKEAFQTLHTVRAYIVASLILVIIVGILLITNNLKHSYIPIRVLADKVIENYPNSSVHKNELLLFEQTFDKFSAIINESSHGLTNQLLSALIRGNFSSKDTFFNACKNLGINYDKTYFAVCSVLIETEAKTESRPLKYETIYTIVKGSLPDSYQLEIMDLLFAKKLVFVLNSDSDDFIRYRSTLNTIKNRLFTEIGLHTTIGMGEFYASYEQIGKSYLESINALDYRLIYGKGSLITSDMYNNKVSQSTYPASELKDLYQALITHNIDAALTTVNRLYEYTRSQNCSLHEAKYICFDIFAILKKIPFYTSVGYVNALSQVLNVTQLTSFETIDDFYSSLITIIQNTIEIANTDVEITDLDIGKKIASYIHENCCSYDFQISTMAEHFGISSQYMRKIFRNYTGQGLSEYVTNIRLDKAEQLLCNTNMSLQDITSHIGLTDVSGFIRIFKKKFGMTPNEYRKSRK